MTTGTQNSGTSLVSVENLSVDFHMENQKVQAVRGVSFELIRGEILGVVGESGSGKSVMCRSILGLLPGTASAPGKV